MKYIGVTGTNGKTSTVQMLSKMLQGVGRRTATIGTLGITYTKTENGEDRKITIDAGLTTPAADTIKREQRNMEAAGVEYLLMEVSSHALTQGRTGDITFDVGIFTNLTTDHLDYHKTMENYKAAKYKLQTLSNSMVFNIDDKTGEEFSKKYDKPKITISTEKQAELRADKIETKLTQTEFLLNYFNTQTHIRIPIPGRFAVYNTMSAMAAMHLLGFSYDQIISVIPEISPVPGRAQLIPTDKAKVMIDFAHTPDALENILKTLKDAHDGRILTLFGCGGERDKTKRPQMGEIAARYSDFIYLTSDNPRHEDPTRIMMEVLPPICRSGKPYRMIANRGQAIEEALKNQNPNDLLLLAGKGHEKYQIIGDEKMPFDEEKIVLKALHFSDI